jgi:hypothetical protein
LRLNRPATYFFSDILIEVVLDFRNLAGWQLAIPGLSQTVFVGAVDGDARDDLNQREETAFVLVGPQLSLLHSFGFSSSLQPTRKHFVTATTRSRSAGSGRCSVGVGYALERWARSAP